VAGAGEPPSGLNLSQNAHLPPVIRRAIAPLLAYHVFILAGAAVLLLAVARSSPFWTGVGSALILGGLVVHAAVLRWTAILVTREPPVSMGSFGRDSGPANRWLCPACGWRGETGVGYCPRCGRFIVRLLPRTQTPDPA
jgi:hypothetical protein